MDFLDPHARRVRKYQLVIGYFLMGTLLLLGTTILLYTAFGFGLDKNGHVIQNGLVFISSKPAATDIYVDGVHRGATNTQQIIESGQHLLQIKRAGYRTWQRAFNVVGGSVEHFDYPFLIPTTLSTKIEATYTTLPSLVTQSPNLRWLLSELPGSVLNFEEYDLSTSVPTQTQLSIPSYLVTSETPGTDSLSVDQWSTDDNYALLKHLMPSGTEYILFDRQNPPASINLTTTLGLSITDPLTIDLSNGAYNSYYIYDGTTHILSAASLSKPTLQTALGDVVAYTTFGTNMILYTTTTDAPSGEVNVRLQVGTTTYPIRTLTAGSTDLLQIGSYNGSWYIAAGASDENKIYVYRNPQQQLQSSPNLPVVPVDILKVTQPTYLSFSADDEQVVAENGSGFAVYNALTDKDYSYSINTPLESPQVHGLWMDGEHLALVSNDKAVIFDYDDANQQTLMPANPAIGMFFDPAYKYVYTVVPETATATNLTPFSLTQTALRTPVDL